MRRPAVVTALALATAAAGADTAAAAKPTTVASGLRVPWGIDFLPGRGGDALVAERTTGRIVRIARPGGRKRVVMRIPGVDTGAGEGGLLGLAVSPDYARDRLVYAYFTSARDNRIVRFRLGGAIRPILTGLQRAENHNGGRLEFGRDGKLYASVGDASDSSLAQDGGSLNGKILRLNSDGSVPDDNPSKGSRIFSRGHRNVQGLAWDGSGRLYASEFGQNRYDEANIIEPGGNYGWPEVEGEGGNPNYIDPISTWTTDEASPSGVEILKGGAIPQWEGDFFMAALRGQRLYRLDLDDSGAVVGQEELLQGEAGRLRHVAQAPDGSLWILTSNRDGRGNPILADDRILRLGPADA